MIEILWDILIGLGVLSSVGLLFLGVIWKPRYVLYFIVFSIPLSIDKTLGGISFSFPVEPLILVYSIGVLVRFFLTKPLQIDSLKAAKSPLFLLWLLGLLWMIFTLIYSELWVVSLKKIIILTLFSGFFYVYFQEEMKTFSDWKKVFACYLGGTFISVSLVLLRHSKFDFLLHAAADMPKPYYAEHTIYGACLAFVLPSLFLNIVQTRRASVKWFWALLLFLYFLFALIVSASRASWLSLLWVSFMGVWVYYKLSLRKLLGVVVFILCIVGVFYQKIEFLLLNNRAESGNYASNIGEHLLSSVNIKTDVSNMERINRWYAALQMTKERPLTGFGPGTYQFSYGAFQPWWLLTRISSRHGLKGGAHSEIFTLLSEQGIPGFIISFLFVLGVILVSLRKLYTVHVYTAEAYGYLALTCGFMTYVFHGIMNVFSDQVEIAALSWMSIAFLSTRVLSFTRLP